ncbi:hypothetical protein Pmar_PMAR022029 [Perkinsus marinus ATCC 50983]|uniref:Uncharacterized protein n=1 Tax=Perkinsus marinus (strain ATCC 50983 / TXsc) TaxID=423536 RepID=C5L637_PERM5|nr:hypothetical protein Pmar_PMAR022029 [Perkinsus marinus ATCC 50983]EER07822.1 hypothetical protein Pmar_PMAR022029 [Perkinsus marinus ATCC 50983]|eukprot:XP_002776006.1 hypothetical protein Pmar_PMAR022029 [Perkinsus marinus ATCC 50983]
MLFVRLLQWVLTTNGPVLASISPDSANLDYRCALPSDVIPRPERLTDDSADFVAVDPLDKQGEIVVANVEYATIAKSGYGNPPKQMPMPSTPDPFVVKTFDDLFGHKTE